ncbi:hypothetical protein AS034_19400 [[Bacillus] enclensis]|uniref:SCP-2 sterol transfer family protein n=1 Tax=[Bacillus] enclensis TaxID=1402860 RepID=A0A0V8H850_9BACI|nr:hypothetical protein [[Bacillus] enclensis]KSU58675.1 hypothetical protein AS034_19400 [[Bacillus] enclensis]SCC32879.1 hypothetical protein GA0061094_4016 [[Bacillus] enclensis]
MRKHLETLIEQCRSKYHLQLLFPSNPFILDIQCKDQRYTISLSSKACMIVEDSNGLESQFLIKGTEDMIACLIKGNELLSHMVDQDQLEIKGGYRPLLFVESVLWLTRPVVKETVEI